MLLAEIQKWYSDGSDEDDAIERLRLRTVLPGYKIHNWVEGTWLHTMYNVIPGCIGKDETKAEKLCSILVQLEYAHTVNLFRSKGAHFKDHLFCQRFTPSQVLDFVSERMKAASSIYMHVKIY